MKKRMTLNSSNTNAVKKYMRSANRYFFHFLFLLFAFHASAQTTSFISFGVEQGLVQSQVQTLVQDNDGNLWVGTLAGLSRYNGLSFENFSKKNGLAEDWIKVSYKDSK